MLPIGTPVTFRAVNPYVAAQSPVWEGTITRRNRKSYTVESAGGIATVPFAFIISPEGA